MGMSPNMCAGVSAHPVPGELDLGSMGSAWDQYPYWGGMVGTLGGWGCLPVAPGVWEGGKEVPVGGGEGDTGRAPRGVSEREG